MTDNMMGALLLGIIGFLGANVIQMALFHVFIGRDIRKILELLRSKNQ